MKQTVILTFTVLGILTAPFVHAQEAATTDYEYYKERLMELREENPEAFRRAIKSRKSQMREHLREMKQNNPERYERMVSQYGEKRRQRFERMRNNNPEQFERRRKNRRDRLEHMRQHNPKQYERVHSRMKEHRRAAREHFRTNNPELAEKIRNAEGSNRREKMRSLKNEDPDAFNGLQKIAREKRNERQTWKTEQWNNRRESGMEHARTGRNVRSQGRRTGRRG